MIDKKHTLFLTSPDASATVVLYATWPGGVALIGESATEVVLVETPTRVSLPLRRNHSARHRATAEQTLLSAHGLPRGEVFVAVINRCGKVSTSLFAVPRLVELDLRVESISTDKDERLRRMPPKV